MAYATTFPLPYKSLLRLFLTQLPFTIVGTLADRQLHDYKSGHQSIHYIQHLKLKLDLLDFVPHSNAAAYLARLLQKVACHGGDDTADKI